MSKQSLRQGMNLSEKPTAPSASEQIALIALGMVDHIGPVTAKKLVAYCGGAQAVFEEKKAHLEKIPGVGVGARKALLKAQVRDRAEAEYRFTEEHDIKICSFLDSTYPKRLAECPDSPIVLYAKGEHGLQAQKVISIVGTRKATDYGVRFTRKLVEGLQAHGALVVSGLALGIDIHAHRAALDFGLPTAAVLAHGLDRIYPYQHRATAASIVEQGVLLTEFPSGTNPDRENFPKRNRIVAGLADAVIVIESAAKGGSIISARLANDYHREVFAVPGRLGDEYSEGCNRLIKSHRAHLLESIADLEYIMGWDAAEETETVQIEPDLSPNAKKVFHHLRDHGTVNIDGLCESLNLDKGYAADLLLDLEFAGFVRQLPGNRYALI